MDLFLRILLIIAIFFVPFSFAGAEPWVFSILQGIVAILLGGILFTRRTLIYTPLYKPVLYLLGMLTLYAAVQSICPQTLLMRPAPYPSTLMRLYTLEHASYFITYAALVFCVMQLAQTSKQVSQLTAWLTACAVAIVLCVLCLPKGQYILALANVRGGYGPFLNRNHGGIYLAASAVLSVGWVVAAWRNRHHIKIPKPSFYARQIWALLLAIAIGVAAVFSRSRGGMLSLSVGLFVFSVLCSCYVPLTWKKRLKSLALVLVVFALGAYWAYTHVDQINEFAQRRTVQDTSIEIRKMLYHAAGDMLDNYPLWGIGIGALPVVVTSYVEKPISSYVERLHSDWLEILVGTGYVGGILILLGLLYFIYIVLRRLRRLESVKQIKLAALVAALVVICNGAVFDFPFFIPATACLFFIITGLACSVSFWKDRTHTWQPALLLRLLVLIIFLAACIIPLRRTLSWRAFLFGRNYKTEMHLQYYQKGLALYPSPRAAARLGNAYYNAAVRSKDPAEKARLLEQANQLSITYLRKYPQEKALSILYMRTRPAGADADISR